MDGTHDINDRPVGVFKVDNGVVMSRVLELLQQVRLQGLHLDIVATTRSPDVGKGALCCLLGKLLREVVVMIPVKISS